MKILPTLVLFACATFLSAASIAHAGSATWNLNPTNGDWNTAANWTPATVPNGATDLATFGVSNTTTVSLSASITVDSIIFNPGASAYAISLGTSSNSIIMTIGGAGIVNNSGIVQNFVINSLLVSNQINFTGAAKAGSMTMFTNVADGNSGLDVSEQFMDQSSADHATFISQGSSRMTLVLPGVGFGDDSTADNATLICNPGSVLGAAVSFSGNSTAANSTVIVNGGAMGHKFGGYLNVGGMATGGDATFIAMGSDVVGGTGGFINCQYFSTLGNATVIAQGGVAAGGIIQLATQSPAGFARVEVFGNGQLQVYDPFPVATIGSLEGGGSVILESSGSILAIGGNSLSTTFSGVIAEGVSPGAISKVSDTTMELSGASTYTGGTTIEGGILVVSNTTGSATGTGAVSVNAGTLGGSGIISGAVTVNSGAFLAPAHGTKTQSTLTIQSPLTFNAGSTYTYTFKAKGKQAKTDKVIANGVTINSGANVTIQGTTKGSLKAGTAYTLISNTSANPLSGTFSNLADGAIVNVNGNNLQASYEGGDGNNLTLMVVP